MVESVYLIILVFYVVLFLCWVMFTCFALSSSCVLCIQCCQCLWFVFFLCLMYPMLPVSLVCLLPVSYVSNVTSVSGLSSGLLDCSSRFSLTFIVWGRRTLVLLIFNYIRTVNFNNMNISLTISVPTHWLPRWWYPRELLAQTILNM